MELQDVNGALFRKVLGVWCGIGLKQNVNVDILLKLGSAADRRHVAAATTSPWRRRAENSRKRRQLWHQPLH